ncbi:MAG: Txe/YoeB family addiction module toxin [Spirochaetaceae bacterium]|jgi:toxin YoeB|nr:Txe/YoeB family addiction module toxin [Spirochaetaceae bacterium]
MKIVFANDDVFNAYYAWTIDDKKIAKKIMTLIKDIARTPYTGLGKPEPLKYELSGYWSREITREHRLVYKVEHETIEILSCKFHYD